MSSGAGVEVVVSVVELTVWALHPVTKTRERTRQKIKCLNFISKLIIFEI